MFVIERKVISNQKWLWKPLQNDQFLWFLDMCLSKMNIIVLFYELMSAFLTNSDYKCYLEQMFSDLEKCNEKFSHNITFLT